MRTFRLFLGLFVGALLIGGAAMAQPMSGPYTIGDSSPTPDDYASFNAAVTDLMSRGVEGAVVFYVEELSYLENVAVGAIVGASAVNTITFRDIGTPDVRPLIKGAASGGSAVLILQGASYLTFDGIDVHDTINGNTVKMEGGCWYNTIRNCAIIGNGVATFGNTGVYIYGGLTTPTPNCYNLLDNVTFNQQNIPLYDNGSGSERDQGLEVRNCTINGCMYGLWLNNTNDARLHDNDITVGWPGNTTYDVYGVYITMNTVAGDSCFVYNNKIHGMQTSKSYGYARGICVMSAPTAASVWIHNNLIYDFIVPAGAYSYGIDLKGGTCGVYFNTIFVNHSDSPREKDGICASGQYLVATLKNNIVVMGQTNSTMNYGIYHTQGVLAASDHNCFYNLGGGTGYRMGNRGATLALWQAYFQGLLPPKDIDLNSVEGNPGFISATNLHIHADSGLVHLRGTPIDGITTDIDGQTRWSMPDIGADEYSYNAPTEDYWVRRLLGWTWLTPELTALTTEAVVVNRGSANQTDVPVVFYYDGLPQDTEYVSLSAFTSDTVTFNWTSPVAPDTIVLEAQSFLTGDTILDNDRALASVRILAQPLAGTYTIGLDVEDDYATFTDAVADLTLRGVSAAVTFEVAEGTYSGQVVIPAAMTPVQAAGIRGASATNTITFRAAPAHLDTPPEIVSTTSPALKLNGADYIIFDGIDIRLTATGKVVEIATGTAGYGGADYNVIKNCLLTGALQTGTSNYGVHFTGGDNDYNVIENVTVDRTVYYPVFLEGVTGARDQENEVRTCTLVGGKQGVTLKYQNGAVVRHCDIQPGWDGATAEIMGIFSTTQTAGELSVAYGNKIHNIRGAGITNGIYATPGANCLFKAYNNFVYDYQVTGSGVQYGLRVASGTSELYSNSVHIGDVGTTGIAYGFYMTTAATTVHLKNNILRVDEPTTACWAIYRASGTLHSDYNAFYSPGPGALYNPGYAGATYPTIMQWQAAGFDVHSVEGDPGFVNATDLHIQPQYSLLNGMGIDTAGIATDIDGEGRGTPPDIGADEYTHTPMEHDYGVNKWVDWVYTYVANVPVVIRAEVKNYGTSAETDVPVVLFYNDVAQDTLLVSLTSGQTDTVELDWTPPLPAGDQEFGTLEVKAFCPGDIHAPNDPIKCTVSVVRAPLSGMYDLGGGAMDYATFNAAVTALTVRGIASEVIFDVYAGTYTENVTIGPIAGTSYTDRIIFRKHDDDSVTLTGAARKTLQIVGCDYLTFDGINFRGFASVDTVVTVKNGSEYVTFQNLSITGLARSGMSYGLQTHLNANHNFLADNVTLSFVQYGITCWTGSGTNTNWEVKNCNISNCGYCIYVQGCYNARVHDNDIQPVGSYAVYCSTVPAGDTVRVYNNRIHNINGSNGIFATVGSNGCGYIYNNFFWDWQGTGAAHLAALMPSTGTTHWYYNTVHLNNLESDAGRKSFYYRSTGTAYVKNNIFVSEEDSDTVYAYNGITSLTADYNCFYDATGANPLFLPAPGYATWEDWQLGTGNDLNTLVGNPGLVSITDLHIDSLATLVDSAGTPIDGITDDIDGDARDAGFPDMGADEYVAVYPPNAVDSLTVFPDTDAGDALLRWVPADGANSYKVYRGTVYGFVLDETTYIGETAGTSYTDVGILTTGGARVYYVVLASTDIVARGR